MVAPPMSASNLCVVCGSASLTARVHPEDVISLLGIPSLCPKHYAELGFKYQWILGINVADSFLQRAKEAINAGQ